MATNCTASGTIAEGDAVCVVGFDSGNSRPTVARASRANLATSKTVFGVAREGKLNTQAILINVSGELTEAGIATGLGAGAGAGTSRIIATDITQDDANPHLQCRLLRVDRPDGSEHVVGTCDEGGHLALQPRATTDTSPQHVLNVRAYGAMGDDATDDTAAIQRAINALHASASGGTLWFPSGVYQISSPIHMIGFTGVRIAGAAPWGERPGAVIRWVGTSAELPMFAMANCSSCAIADIQFDAPGARAAEAIRMLTYQPNPVVVGTVTTTGGSIVAGNYSYEVAFAFDDVAAGTPEEHESPTSRILSFSYAAVGGVNTGKVSLTIPIGPEWVTTRRVYRRKQGMGGWDPPVLVITQNDNTTTAVDDISGSTTTATLQIGTTMTRCRLDRVAIGDVEVGVRVGGGYDANNDFHVLSNVSITNYGHTAVAIEGTQAYDLVLDNCVLAGRWQATLGTIEDASRDVLRLTSNPFTALDVGKYIEIMGAGDLNEVDPASIYKSVHHARIVSVVPGSPGTVTLDTAAARAVGQGFDPPAPVTYGSQIGIRNASITSGVLGGGGSFELRGGATGSNLWTDVYVGGANYGACTLRNAGFEGSRRFLDTGGQQPDQLKKVTVEGCRWAGDRVLDGHAALVWLFGGQLLVVNTTIGDRNPLLGIPPMQFDFNYTLDNQEYAMVLFDNVDISSSKLTTEIMRPSPHSGIINEFRNCRHWDGTTMSLLGTQEKPLDAASGTIQLNWGDSRFQRVTLTGNATFSLDRMYVGMGTPMRLMVTQVGGPWTVAFTSSAASNIYWSSGQPTFSADTTAIFELLFDGADVYAMQLGTEMSATALGFDPFAPADLVVGYRYEDANVTGGGKVDSWTDQSGGANHAIEATSGQQPVYTANVVAGHAALTFAGGQILHTTSTVSLGSFTLYVSFRMSGTAGLVTEQSANAFSSGNNGFWLYGTSSYSIHRRLSNVDSSKDRATNWATDSAWRVVTVTYDGTSATHEMHINNVLQTMGTINSGNPGTTPAADTIFIGARSGLTLPMTGDIVDYILYDTAHDATKRASIVDWMKPRVGL
jgi:hypothetical protein